MKKLIVFIFIGLMLIALPACGAREPGEGETMNTEKEVVLAAVDNEEQAEGILEIVHMALPDESVTEAKAYSDNVGSGLRMRMNTGRLINVYIDKTGFVYGIKDVKTEEYLYAVYE